ncbi:hypothetical protein HAX54_002061 [Datura stramonium]|uniref:Uncharacterized protein n=1 Tax=Datura stramonium TaxID=4076 RepID=A0ABS8T4V3_DATST|nr:hypothetical protein [Datura stramonium]
MMELGRNVSSAQKIRKHRPENRHTCTLNLLFCCLSTSLDSLHLLASCCRCCYGIRLIHKEELLLALFQEQDGKSFCRQDVDLLMPSRMDILTLGNLCKH